MGGLHSGETGPSEMLMELVYRLATETSPFISQIRDNVIVSVTPVADADGRDRNVDNFYCNRAAQEVTPAPAAANPPAAGAKPATGAAPAPAPAAAPGAPAPNGCALPYWGKYVFHDNNRDINLSQKQMRAITDWYFTAHPPIMHDLHESLSLLYTYSGGAPQNPNLDPLLFAELPFFSNWELSQMTKWGMPGVYTHAFMDGWSPGYLGSVAYNHNGMMRMYETQSGRDGGPDRLPAAAVDVAKRAGAARRPRRRGGDAGARGGGAGRAGAPPPAATRQPATTPPGRRRAPQPQGAPPARGAGRPRGRRRWRRRTRQRPDRARRRPGSRVVSRDPGAAGHAGQLHAPQQHELHADGRALRAAAHLDVPEPRRRELLREDAELDRAGQEHARRTAT